MNRTSLALLALLVVLIPSSASAAEAPAARPPNFVLIDCDDLGYADLGCYGHPSIRTPNLDRMAAEGRRFTDFYAASSVCTPSRAALMTGRYAPRSGMASIRARVLFRDSRGGLPDSEVTLPQALTAKGYATGCVGKWHLGHLPQYLPTRRGFDEYFGIPYSNDMKPSPLMKGTAAAGLETVEEPAVQPTLTKRYTAAAVDFLKRKRDEPFFLYVAHTMPHVPLAASGDFKGKSPRGLYGDAVEEIDWSTGEILAALKELKLDRNTIVVFTSDNGPWLPQRQAGGSAGLLRDGKGSTWEGGQRVPGIFWWPGTIAPGGPVRALGCQMDLFATFAALAGAKVPADRPFDGVDLTPVLTSKAEQVRDAFFYYRDDQLWAARVRNWKAHYVTRPGYGKDPAVIHERPLLFNLDVDPGEQFDVAANRPEVLAEIAKVVDAHKATLTPAENQLETRGPAKTPAGAKE